MKKVVVSVLLGLGLSVLSTAPSQAADVSQYVQFISPITTQTIELPKTGTSKDIEFMVKILNPTKDVNFVEFELYDADGSKISSDFMYFWSDESEKIERKTFDLYSFFSQRKLPLSMKVIVKFEDSAAKFNIDQTFTLNVIPNRQEAVEKAIAEEKAKAEVQANTVGKDKYPNTYNAIVKAFSGTKCTKLNKTMKKSIFNTSVRFKCVKSGSKLVWKKA